jgi:hypothetical protein
MSIRITCIKKSGGHHADPHHAISELGWTNEQTREQGTSTRLVVYDWIKNQNGVAYVRDSRGTRLGWELGNTRTASNSSRHTQIASGRTICWRYLSVGSFPCTMSRDSPASVHARAPNLE